MEIRLRTPNHEQVLRSIGRLNKLLSTDGQTPQQIVLEETLKIIHASFDQQTSPQGVPWPPTTSGRPALRGLRDSFFGSIGRSSVTVRSTRPAEVAAHDEGMEITAKKKGGLLAIPFTGMRAPKGVSYREAYPGAFVIPSPKDISKLFLVIRNAKTGKGSRNEDTGRFAKELKFIATLVYAVKMPKRGIWPGDVPPAVITRLVNATQSIWEGF